MNSEYYNRTYETIRLAAMQSADPIRGNRFVISALLELLVYTRDVEDKLAALTERLDNLPPTTLHPIA